MESVNSSYGVELATKLLILLLLGGLVYYLRPLFHTIVYAVLYNSGMLLSVGLPVAVAVLLFLLPDGSPLSRDQKASFVLFVFLALVVISVVYSVPAGMVKSESIAKETMDDAVQVSSFPEVNEQNPRVVPQGVSDKQTRGTVSYRQHRLGTSDIARMENGELGWGYPIRPDPIRIQLTGNQRGVYISDMTSTDNRTVVSADEQQFTHGTGMFFHRSSWWNVRESGYFSRYYDDPVAFTHNGTAFLAYPKTGHKWNLTPIPHTVPTWEGVALVSPSGDIQHLSPEQARNSEILEGQRIYPLYNAQIRTESLSYRNGIVNQLPVIGKYQGVVETASVPNTAGNSQPFVIDTEKYGMAYSAALEPYGETSRGLDEVWFYDGDSGKARYFRTGEQQLFGPERAMDIVRSEDSQTGWVSTTEGGNFKVVEPIPTIIENELWWHLKVVTADDTDVARSVFVNADTQATASIQDSSRISEFLSGEENISNTSEMPGQRGETQNGSSIAYYIVVRNEDGSVADRIPVREGQNTTIESDGLTNSTSETG